MVWTRLATQFALELGFGVFFALAFVPRAPVGRLFYRIMATTGALPLFAVASMPLWLEGARWNDASIWTSSVALLAYPFLCAPVRGARFGAALAWCLAWTVIAIATTVATAELASTPAVAALGTLSALATGSVAGSVSLAMVLGHWYLTIPTMPIHFLTRLNRVTIGSMIASIVLVSLTCWWLAEPFNAGEAPLTSATGLFYLGTRLVAGLVLPLVFAAMTAASLAYQNTRSATGILYASTILVLIGTAVSISLQDSYGFPL